MLSIVVTYDFFLIFLFLVFYIPDYAIVSFPNNEKFQAGSKSQVTFVSANLLLGIESLGKFQNMPFVYSRLSKIGKSFTHINDQLSEPLSNAPILNDTKIPGTYTTAVVYLEQWFLKWCKLPFLYSLIIEMFM